MPLADQSALAGVILAAAVVRSAQGADPPTTLATRMNLLEEMGVDFRCRWAREAIAAVDVTTHCSATEATQSTPEARYPSGMLIVPLT